jgi:hypothetical protein
MLASNVADRSEILRRGNWTERGVMLALDGANLIADIAIASQAEDDPPVPQTPEQFAANPGSVTDFNGRAGQLNLKADLVELGLSGLDAVGAFGREDDENKLHYGLTHGAMMALGIPLFFFSAPISGAECAPDGTFLFKCGFGTTANTNGQYFSTDTFDSSPEDMAQLETQFLVSSIGSALMMKGGEGVIKAFAGMGKEKKSGGGEAAGSQTAFAPTLSLSVGRGGGMGGMRFNW